MMVPGVQAVKALGWAAGAGATAGGAYMLLHDSPSTSGRGAPSAAISTLGGNSGSSMQGQQQAARHLVLAAAGVSGLVGVGCGAFGFHGLKR